jgi:hypothetical protein
MNNTQLSNVAALARFAALALTLGTLAGCGGELRDGETECEFNVCAPGQYCDGGLFCSAGCTSDANCLSNSRCVDINSVIGTGICEESAANPNPNPNPNPVPMTQDTTCDGYVNYAKSCGLLASQAEAIRLNCGQLDSQTQTALVACAASQSCSEFMTCSGVECFGDEQCPVAKADCIMPNEVVDPFVDVAFTCR